jgi:hypothetical protein
LCPIEVCGEYCLDVYTWLLSDREIERERER